MITSKSPLAVIRQAYQLGLECLPLYSSQFSRRDYTLPQLFACLVIREHQKKTHRGVEALLADSPSWLAAVGLARAPAPQHALPRVPRHPQAVALREHAGRDCGVGPAPGPDKAARSRSRRTAACS